VASVPERCRKKCATGQSARAAGSAEVGLETLKTHRPDGNDEGEFLRLSLAVQEPQVRYGLSRKSANLRPRVKFQWEVECLPERSSLLACPVLHNFSYPPFELAAGLPVGE